MFDLRDLQENFDVYEKAWASRSNPELLKSAEAIRTSLQIRKDLIRRHEELLAERNRASEEIAKLKQAGQDVAPAIAKQKELGPQVKDAEKKLQDFQTDFDQRIASLPNLPFSSVPVGKSADDNKEVNRWGTPKEFSFAVKSHEVLGELRGWMNFEKASQITGARFSILKGAAARLERALIQFMLDRHTQKNSYEEVVPPFLANETALYGTGNLPKFKEDLFKIEGFPYFLIPTAEVPLSNLHSGEILKLEDLPKYYTAYTPCFRSEAGSHGKDLKGLIRQHQFNKVELVKLVHPEKSEEEHEKMRKDAESILEALELPYRTVVLCTGDMGFASRKTFDLEVWLPSQKQYREISSVSNCGDFQARRMMTRFKDAAGKTQYVHTLNGSGLAVGRTLIAILENYQNEDGSVSIPPSLQSYMDGRSKI
jgi:seryl-tRNA synthetase